MIIETTIRNATKLASGIACGAIFSKRICFTRTTGDPLSAPIVVRLRMNSRGSYAGSPKPRRRTFLSMSMLRRTWGWIAGATLIPLAAGASTSFPTVLVQNGAPISIDRCLVLSNTVQGNPDHLSENVDFTNVSRQTATEVRFAFKIVDTSGRMKQILAAESAGSFAAGIAIDQAKALLVDPNDAKQTVNVVPNGAKVFCSVTMVRFDDGSVWHEGDGPAGSAVIYTPLPGPSPTPPWQWPDDQPTP
jgi:hypothetical protein